MILQPPYRDYRDLLAEGPFDLLIADIPWSYQQPNAHAKGAHLITYPTFLPSDYPEMMCHFAAALRPDRNLWIWSDYFNLPPLFMAAAEAGLTYRGLAVVRRKALWLGRFMRHNIYFLQRQSLLQSRGGGELWAGSRCVLHHAQRQAPGRL